MKIPNIKADLPSFEEIEEQFREILQNGQITNFGKYLLLFEKEASAYLGTEVVSVSSCTMGLIFALQALGLPPGGKVILPSFTFMATAQAVLYAGGRPVFADIDDDMTLSSSDLEWLLDEHNDVAIVLPVHTYGLPCKVNDIQRLVDRAAQRYSHPISVLYDAAHAFGSAVAAKRVGSFGNAEVFSLSVTKTLVSAEGGMVSSFDSQLISKIRMMRNYGIKESYNAYWPGLNGKMSEFHAIIGLHNLRRLNTYLEKRKKIAQYYLDNIHNHTEFKTQPIPKDITHTFKDVTILLPDSAADKRDEIMVFLKERGIETRAYFCPPVHKQFLFQRFSERSLPNTEDLSRRVITLPFYTTISEKEIDYIVEALVEMNRRFL